MRSGSMNRTRNLVLSYAIAIVVLLILGRNLYLRYYKFSTIRLTGANTETIEIEANTLFFFDETLYDFGEFGSFTGTQVEGRIPVGELIGTVSGHSLAKPGEMNGGMDTMRPSKDSELTSEERLKLYESVREDFLKDQTSNALQKGKAIPDAVADGKSRSSKEEWIRETAQKGGPIYSPGSGYIYYTRDGFEELLTLDALDRIKPGELVGLGETVPGAIPLNGFRLVNNSRFGAIVTTGEQIESVKPGDEVTVLVGQERVPGEVVRVETGEGQNLLQLLCTSGYEAVQAVRSVKGLVQLRGDTGYALPQSALKKEKESHYVYRVNHTGSVEIVYVRVLATKKGLAIISQGTDGKLEIEGKLVPTVRGYDEVILHPEAVQVGDYAR